MWVPKAANFVYKAVLENKPTKLVLKVAHEYIPEEERLVYNT